LSTLLLFSTAIPCGILNAQETNENSSTVTYQRTDFEKYSPVTLIDILERIPGVPEVLNQGRRDGPGGGDRGFGSGGDQVLINGKRLSAKSNSIRDILSRMSATQVERIELIRGATDGLDVQSQGLVINVVLMDGANQSSFFWKLGGTYMVGEDISPEIEASYKSKIGNLDYTFAIEGENKHGYFRRDEVFFDGKGIETGQENLDGDYQFRGINPTANLTYNTEGGTVINLNGDYNNVKFQNDQYRVETGEDASNTYWDAEEAFFEWEIGGDIEMDLGGLGKLKSLFLKNRNKNKFFTTQRYDGLGDAQYLYNDEDIDFERTEEIYRASLTKSLTEKQSLEIGAESALNGFYQKFENYERDEQGDPLELTESNNIRIKEKRYEVFVHHSYTLSSNLVLQSSLTTEFSQITATSFLEDGGVNVDDDKFTFFKPRVNFRYDVNDRNQIRLLAEKQVSQLEFFNYITFFDQQTKEFKSANTSIKPQQTWDFSATYEYRLPNDGGTIEAKAFYKHYKDYITRIDFTEYEDFGGNSISEEAFFALSPDTLLRENIDFTTKSGNIDKASSAGFEIKSNLRLGFVGLAEAQLGLSYTYERRRYESPFTGETYPFNWNSDHEITMNFRHDLTDYNFSYGGEAKFVSSYQNNDIDYNWIWQPDDSFEIFAEYKLFGDMKLRVEGSQGRRTHTNATFYRYQDHKKFGETKGRDEQYHHRPYEIEFSIEGTF
jgi:outer membrane receptor for ferrienterochelin and colicins